MRTLCSALLVLSLAGASLSSAENVDLEVVHRIKREAFAHSKVMDILFQLTDVNGSRLTGSPGYKAASEWAANEMESWGLANATGAMRSR